MKQLRQAEPITVALEGSRLKALHWRGRAYAVQAQGDAIHYRGEWYSTPGLEGKRRVYLPLETSRGQLEVYSELHGDQTQWFITRMWD